MITEMMGSPMSGRSTPRSITRPSRTATPRVTGSATYTGSFIGRMVAHAT
jgi:hypothetical protein